MTGRACLAALLLWGACAGDGGQGGLPPEVELGTGEVEFEPVADGDELYIIQGPQGGYHINASARISGIAPGDPDDLEDPDNPTTEFRIFRDGERVDAGVSRYIQGLAPTEEPNVYEMIGRRVILDILDDDQLAGSELRIEVEVADVFGNQASDERRIQAIAHPSNQ